MTPSPLISVILPVYNTDKYLDRCLKSIISQTYQHLEILCVNDGSTDSSYDILLKYANIDNRIKIINKENEGAAIARNTALHVATGTYVTFVDSDDELYPEAYAKAVTCFSANMDVVCFGTEEHTGDTITSPIKTSSYFSIKKTSEEEVTDNFISVISKTIWNKLFRRDIIAENNIQFPATRAFEDNAFVVKYLLHAKKAYMLEDKLYIYYMRCGSIMNIASQHKENKAMDMIYVLNDIFSYMNTKGMLSERISVFEYQANTLYRGALAVCSAYEKADITAGLIRILRKCEHLQDKNLTSLVKGDYEIPIGAKYICMNIQYLCNLKGFEKIFSVVNYRNYKYICLLSKPIFKIKKT